MSYADSMDPRRRATDPRKRPPSHSPEPDRPQKQARSGHPTEAASPRDADPSRGPSVSNGAARAGSPPGATNKLKSDLCRDAEGGMQSPTSPRNGSGSGRSTPQQTITTKELDQAASNPILAALQAFSSAAAAQASFEIEHRQAQQFYKRACSEYQSSKQYFSGFPALEEKKSALRKQASETSLQAKEALEKHINSQTKMMENLAALIGSASQRTDIKSSVSDTDMLNKHEGIASQYNTLSTSINSMQQRLKLHESEVHDAKRSADGAINTAAQSMKASNHANKVAEEAKIATTRAVEAANASKDLFSDMSKSVREVKADADKAVKLSNDSKRVADMAKSAVDKSLQFAKDSKSFESQLANMTNDIDRVAKQSLEAKKASSPQSKGASTEPLQQTEANLATVRKELATFKKEASSQYALKEEVAAIETKQDTLIQSVAGIRKTNVSLSKDVGQMKSGKGSSSALDAAYTSRVDQRLEQIPRLVEKLDSVEQQVAKIKSIVPPDHEQTSNDIHAHGSLLGWTLHLEQSLHQMREDFETLSDGIDGDGRDAVKRRLTNLDVAVNNLSTRLGNGKTAIPQQITTIEKRVVSPQEGVDSAKSATSASQTSLEDGEIFSQQPRLNSYGQQGNLIARVPDLERRYTTLREEFDDLKKRVRVDSPSGHATMDQSTLNRLADIEERLKNIDEQSEEKDANVYDEIGRRDSLLRIDLEKVTKQNQDKFSVLDEALTGAQKIMGDIRKSLQSKVSQETYQKGVTEVINPIRDSLHKLQGAVAQHQKQRQSSISTPQPPSFGQSPQLTNGVSSPQPDGTQRVPTPTLGRAPTPQNQALQDIARLQRQIDSMAMSLSHLKQRYDNLITDEVVKAMVDQMSSMYPEARNFSSSYKALAKRIDSLVADVAKLQRNNVSADVYALRTRVTQLEEAFREATETAKRVEQEAAGVKNTANTLSKAKSATPTPGPASSVTQADLKALEDQLQEVRGIAKATEFLSKGHSSRFTNLDLNKKKMDEMQEAINVVKQHKGKIDGMEWKLKDYLKLKEDVDGLTTDLMKVSAGVEAMEERQKNV